MYITWIFYTWQRWVLIQYNFTICKYIWIFARKSIIYTWWDHEMAHIEPSDIKKKTFTLLQEKNSFQFFLTTWFRILYICSRLYFCKLFIVRWFHCIKRPYEKGKYMALPAQHADSYLFTCPLNLKENTLLRQYHCNTSQY